MQGPRCRLCSHPPHFIRPSPSTRKDTSRSHGKTLEQPHSWAVATRCIKGSNSSLESPPGTSPHTLRYAWHHFKDSQHVLYNCGYPSQGPFSPHLTCFRPQHQIPPLHQVCPPQSYHLALDTHSSTQWGKEQTESGLHILSINLHHDASSW